MVPALAMQPGRPPPLVAAMFRKTSPQLSLMESSFLVTKKKRARLERSWSQAFRIHVLPLIDEEAFRECFCQDNGRPNTLIRLLVGLHLLKEADDLTDEQVLDALEFNLQWQHALGVQPEDAHVAEKTLHNFRGRLADNARARTVFEQLTEALMKADGLSAVRQRLDSTHVMSNIAVLTRLGLFTETVSHFLRQVRKDAPEAFGKLEGGYAKRYLDREGFFADAKREQARRRLPVAAQDLYALVRAFEGDEAVRAWDSYASLVRLLREQCDVTGGEGEPPKVEVKEPKGVSGASLQSPHDPDATYGHKGKGYEAQVTETCGEDNPYEVITAIEVTGAHASDQHATVPMVDHLEERGIAPEVMLADTGYGSGENIVACAERGVESLGTDQDPASSAPKARWEQAVEAVSSVPTTADRAGTESLPAGGPGSEALPAAGAEPAGEAAPVVEADPDGLEATKPAANPAHEVSPPAAPLDLGDFTFNLTFGRVLDCPEGQTPIKQHATGSMFRATFPAAACAGCPLAALCPTRIPAGGEGRELEWKSSKAATASRQHEQQRPDFKDAYKLHSGIESTNAEWKGRHGAGDLRVRGKARVEVALYLKALALNAKRAMQYHTTAARAALATADPAAA